MKIIYQVGLLFTICWGSELAASALPVPFPASVIGMLVLFALLATGVVRVEHVREKSDFLLANMAFFFIPAGVSVVNYLGLLRDSFWKLLVICLVTTVITFGATAMSLKAVTALLRRAAQKRAAAGAGMAGAVMAAEEVVVEGIHDAEKAAAAAEKLVVEEIHDAEKAMAAAEEELAEAMGAAGAAEEAKA